MESIFETILKTRPTSNGEVHYKNKRDEYPIDQRNVSVERDGESNILIIGHSWVSHLESEYDKYRHNPDGHDVKFRRVTIQHLEDAHRCIGRSLDHSATHILLFFIFRLAYTRVVWRPTSIESHHEEYDIFLPNLEFKAEDAILHIQNIYYEVEKYCPSASLFVMIPTIPDLHYYNYHHCISFAPKEVQDWYDALPRTSPEELNEDTIAVYNEINRLHTKELRWPRKRTISVSQAVSFMSPPMKTSLQMLATKNNETYSLGPSGFLKDGIHPSPELVDALWVMMNQYNIFQPKRLIVSTSSRPPQPEVSELFLSKSSESSSFRTASPPARPKLIPVRKCFDHKSKDHSRLSFLSTSSSIPNSPYSDSSVSSTNSSTLQISELLPSTSRGITDQNRFYDSTSYWTNKRPASPPLSAFSPPLSALSKKHQTISPLSIPWRNMTLHELGLVQAQFNKFLAYMLGVVHTRTNPVNEEELGNMLEVLLRNYNLQE